MNNSRALTAAMVFAIFGVTYSLNRPVPRATGAAGEAAAQAANAGERDRLDQPEDYSRILGTAMDVKAFAVVATVPDPDRTGLRLYTDRTLDALRMAASNAGYVLLDGWLPWRQSSRRVGEDEHSQETVARLKLSRRFPGLMLFRGGGEHLLMFVVPESPTLGLDYNVLAKTSIAPQLPLIGPCYTGSLRDLDRWLKPRKGRIGPIVTGTASGVDPKNTGFEGHEFRWARVPQKVSRERLIKVWRDIRGSVHLKNVVESATGFSRVVVEQMTAKENEAKSNKKTGSDGGATVQFPWQISRLRQATPDVGAGGAVATRFLLPFQMRSSSPILEAVPTFAPDQTPTSQETVLARVAERLDEIDGDENGSLVTISATDVMDVLFMARYLRQVHRNERMLLFTTDLLYLRAADVMPVTGMLTIASYPQFTPDLTGSPGDVFFDSEWSEAIFHAAVAVLKEHLGPKLGLPDAAAAARPAARETVRGPLHRDGQLWLSITGRDGVWPLALMDGTAGANPARGDVVWASVFLGAIGLLMAWSVKLLDSARRGQPLPRSIPLTATLQALVASVSLPVWLPYSPMHDSREWSDDFFAIVFYAAIALSTAVLFWAHRDKRWKWLALGLPVAMALGALGWWDDGTDAYRVKEFFLLRALAYSSGVSPALPLAVAMISVAAMVWQSATRSRNRRNWEPVLDPESPSGEAAEASAWSFSRLEAAARKACDSAHVKRMRAGHWPAMMPALVTMVIGVASSSFFHSAEQWEFDAAFLVGMLCLIWATISSIARFVSIWHCLREFLVLLEMHPARRTLQALAREAVTSSLWNFDFYRRQRIQDARTYECLSRVSALENDGARTLSAREKLRRWLTGEDESRSPADQALANLARDFHAQLRQGLWREGRSQLETDGQTEVNEMTMKAEVVAVRWVGVVRYVMLQMQTLLYAGIYGFVAIALSLNSYPFGQERAIAALLAVLSFALGGACVLVFAQMSRDAALSRLSETQAGQLDWGFLWKLGTAAALPLGSMLASYSPGVARLLGGFLQPAVEALQK